MKKRIALIFGGEGAERKISEISAEGLASVIDKNLYDLILIGITDVGEWYIYDGDAGKINDSEWLADKSKLTPTYPVKLGEKSGFLCREGILSVSCAVPCLHGNFGEDGVIQGALQAAHIPYVGQDVYASAFTSDKAYTKLAAEHLGIPTAKWMLSTRSDANAARREAQVRIGYPMFLKPTRLGSSYGAHPVCCQADFESAYNDAYSLDGRVLIEELIRPEYELECAFFESDGVLLAPYGRIMSGGSFYDYESKYQKERSPKTEADRSENDADIEASARKYSEKLIEFIGLRHLSRIDFFVTENKDIYFNEINTFPGMTKTSLYPRLTETLGFGRGEFINLLIKEVCASDRGV